MYKFHVTNAYFISDSSHGAESATTWYESKMNYEFHVRTRKIIFDITWLQC